MGKYYVGAKQTQVIALLHKLNLQIKRSGSKHLKAVASSGNTIPIPKKHKSLSNGVVENICEFLIEEGYDVTIIDKYIK